MARHCTTATLAKQIPKQDMGQQLSEWRKRLQLLGMWLEGSGKGVAGSNYSVAMIRYIIIKRI